MGLVPRATLETAVSERGQSPAEFECSVVLRPVFGDVPLSDLTAEAIEDYVANGLWDERKVRTKFGIQLRGEIKPATVHQEFRLLSHILNEIHSQAPLLPMMKEQVELDSCGRSHGELKDASATCR